MPTKGYATGFEGLLDLITNLLPANEIIRTALRHTVPMYPDLAVRELVANSLIHQDFTLTGTGPMVEIFADRMEITNPGRPLVQTDRFLDMPPRSRNEGLASFMIEPRNSATASRLIREAVEAGAIRAYDDTAAKKLMKYVPFWA